MIKLIIPSFMGGLTFALATNSAFPIPYHNTLAIGQC